MTICIISHTEHYLDQQNQIVGWGSTVREINHLLEIAEHIIHLAPLHNEKAPASSLAYCDERIQFVPLKPSGGRGIQKLSILVKAFFNLKQIHKYTKNADFIQFRAPTGMGLYVLPYLRFFRNKNYWVKYAGNWTDENMPLGNTLQKLFLLNCISKHTKVTYNGNWVKKSNFLSFENPCLTEKEYQNGINKINQKKSPSNQDWQMCFVGSLTTHKGVHLLLEAIQILEANAVHIASLHIVGNGTLLPQLKKKAENLNLLIVFHGFLNRIEVNEVLSKSHALILPSKSEGFPKVIGEAMNYGCIPIVTNISCLKDYITHGKNGILMPQQNSANVVQALKTVCSWNIKQYTEAIHYNSILAERFTYAHYNKALLEKIMHV